LIHAYGQITLATTPNIQNVTNNSAELVAFTHALQWAATRPDIHHIVMRYDSLYAAMIASGVWNFWKAKKQQKLLHGELWRVAAEAQRAWMEGTEEQARRDRMAKTCQGPLGSRMEQSGGQVRRHRQTR